MNSKFIWVLPLLLAGCQTLSSPETNVGLAVKPVKSTEVTQADREQAAKLAYERRTGKTDNSKTEDSVKSQATTEANRTTTASKQAKAVKAETSGTVASAKKAQTPAASKQTAKQGTPQGQQDLWQRIAMQMTLDVPNNKQVAYYRNWFKKHPEHLQVLSERAQPYLYEITQEIEKRGLPLELALLPAVESTYDPFAKSWGGATGLWQFMPATGRSLGLQKNRWYDGTRDVDASTKAALTYLTQLNKRFNGNWEHAIAAYNSGGGRVSSAIRANRNAGKSTDFFALNLPKETRSYVPKLLALADILKNPNKYGVSLPPIPNKPAREKVTLDRQVSLANAARYAGVSVATLKQYNPAYLSTYTPARGPKVIHLPVGRADGFKQAMRTNTAAPKAQTTAIAKNSTGSSYTVRSGDSLSLIATKTGVSTQSLRQANSLSGDTIQVGQTLALPSNADIQVAQKLESQVAAKQSRKLTYKVQSGDSLSKIAQKHQVNVASLASWNDIAHDDNLQVGQELVIWRPAS